MECKRPEIRSLIKKNSINPLKILNVLQAYRVIRIACQSQPDIQRDPYKYYLKSRTKFTVSFSGLLMYELKMKNVYSKCITQ